MKVLVIGSGAREHAIAHALLRGGSVDEVTVAPGNPGMELDGIRTQRINPSNHAAMIDFVKDNEYDWVFVGPEVPLIEGIVDDFEQAGIKAFGPTKAAAQIEGSKDFAKRLMARHNIPTAQYRTFDELEPAEAYVREHGAPIVIKADGLAAGKGVTVAMDEATALHALEDIFVDHRFGSAGAKVVIEDFLEGQEFSLMSFVHGTDFWPMPISQDHKRAYDNDEGANTGGMGTFSPSQAYTDDIAAETMANIILPTMKAMNAEGRTFKGVLYFGLMLTADGVKVLEYNARFGDPETQVVLPRLKTDLYEIFDAIIDERLCEVEIEWDDMAAVCVILASGGYPGSYKKGVPIEIGDIDKDVTLYHAGTAFDKDGRLVTSGGRVIGVTARGKDIAAARAKAYANVQKIKFDGAFWRTDIGIKK